MNGTQQFLVYADDVNTTGESLNSKENAKASGEVGLEIKHRRN
jgi:hypothetical protein